MLRPKDTSTRERKALDGLWQFRLDPDGVGRTERWWGAPLAGARAMPVPASYNDIVPDAAVRDHVGDGNKKGAFTRDRRPKAAAFALRSRWTALRGPRSH